LTSLFLKRGWDSFSLSRLTYLLYKNTKIFIQDFFGIFKNGQKKCPKTDFRNIFPFFSFFVTIKILKIWSPKKELLFCDEEKSFFRKKDLDIF
jgi:hypothetical protein